jgi:FkbM family methyltransferase
MLGMISTSAKIRIARVLSAFVLLLRRFAGLTPNVVAQRRGVTWQLNLAEGIDFAIYLLGGFEVRTLRRYQTLIREGDVVLDIGANVGAHTLPLARLVGETGRVYAFEPTEYAYTKQLANSALNPHLAPRISAQQMMLTSSNAAELPPAVYSSWPLESAEDLHVDHHGRLMATEGARPCTLDTFLAENGVTRVDLIKIDVDGNEAAVLRGAQAMLQKFRPQIMIELAPYVYGDPNEFDQLIESIAGLGYQFKDMTTGRVLPKTPAALRRSIPEMGGLNVLASTST